MSSAFRKLAFIFVILVITMIIVISANGITAQGFPPTATPVATPRSGSQPPVDFQTLVGKGFDQAPLALQASLPQLPFHARLPGDLPKGMKLFHSTVQIFGVDKKHGNLDLSYFDPATSGEQMTLHIYETNQSLEDKKSTQVSEIKSITIGSDVWSYRLLTYPQPGRSTLKLHNLYRTFEDGVYVDLDIHAGTAPDATLAELTKVVSSLR